MKRRRFLSSVTLVFAGSVIGPQVMFSSCTANAERETFSQENIDLLNEIGEMILPATETSPGAKAANVGGFMKVYVTDCYTTDNQEIFLEGIRSFKKHCLNQYKSNFENLSVSNRQKLLRELDREAAEHAENRKNQKAVYVDADAVQSGKTVTAKPTINPNAEHYFSMIRNLTMLGYFTSEPGATKALRYMQTPGYYAGDIPYKKGDRAWAL